MINEEEIKKGSIVASSTIDDNDNNNTEEESIISYTDANGEEWKVGKKDDKETYTDRWDRVYELSLIHI